MNNASLKTPARLVVYLLMLMHVLTGCAPTTGSMGTVQTGPQMASAHQAQPERDYDGIKLEVVIPVFDPGLSETASNYEEEGIWPELRRAEANRFAYKLKQALDETNHFGAVRVAPNATASGDLYVLGGIIESTGQRLRFDIQAIDASNQQWLRKTIRHDVHEGFYKNPRNDGKDPYDPAFEQAAQDIVAALLRQQATHLAQLQSVAELRFAASFNEQAFAEHLDTTGRQIKLNSKPSDADPALERVRSIRVREQLFVDNLQQNYSNFSVQMEDSYLAWQEASAREMQLQREARNKSRWQILGGAALVAAAIAAAVAGDPMDRTIGRDMATVAGGIGGAMLISSGFKSRQEAEFHQGAINELGESINLEMAPQVMRYEEESVELTGNIEEQFQQWRTFLARMYELEATPDIQL